MRKQKELRQNIKCAECKKDFLVGVAMPYYFSDYGTFWLCPTCVKPVHARYRNENTKG